MQTKARIRWLTFVSEESPQTWHTYYGFDAPRPSRLRTPHAPALLMIEDHIGPSARIPPYARATPVAMPKPTATNAVESPNDGVWRSGCGWQRSTSAAASSCIGDAELYITVKPCAESQLMPVLSARHLLTRMTTTTGFGLCRMKASSSSARHMPGSKRWRVRVVAHTSIKLVKACRQQCLPSTVM